METMAQLMRNKVSKGAVVDEAERLASELQKLGAHTQLGRYALSHPLDSTKLESESNTAPAVRFQHQHR
jgi:hypothetical protein